MIMERQKSNLPPSCILNVRPYLTVTGKANNDAYGTVTPAVQDVAEGRPGKR